MNEGGRYEKKMPSLFLLDHFSGNQLMIIKYRQSLYNIKYALIRACLMGLPESLQKCVYSEVIVSEFL